MTILVSFFNKTQYENNQNNTSIITEITQDKLDKILEVFEFYLADPPNYHCRLYNDAGNEIYLTIITK